MSTFLNFLSDSCKSEESHQIDRSCPINANYSFNLSLKITWLYVNVLAIFSLALPLLKKNSLNNRRQISYFFRNLTVLLNYF